MKKKLSIVCLCLLLALPLFSIAEDKESVSEAVIFGYTVKLGQLAGIVQSRIKADKFEFTYNIGDPSIGEYNDKGVKYIITYGLPHSVSDAYALKSFAYVVTKIEKVTNDSRNKSPDEKSIIEKVTNDSRNKSPDEKSIKSALEYGLRNYKQVSIRGVSLVGRKLIISVSIDRTSPQAFFAALGGIHGGIAVLKPDVDTVVIKDIIGQRITVEMSKLLANYNKQISFREFRDTWDIINP